MELDEIKSRLDGHPAEPIREAPETRFSVLVPLVERDGALCVLFEERNADIPQGGEICFPGGRIEAGETPAEAVLRETCEELRMEQSGIELVSPLHVLQGNGMRVISSFLGVLRGYNGDFSPDEVSRVFLIPLDWFLRHKPDIYEGKTTVSLGDDFPFHLIPGGRNYRFAASRQYFYFYPTDQGVIWGLTAKLLYHFIRLLRPEG